MSHPQKTTVVSRKWMNFGIIKKKKKKIWISKVYDVLENGSSIGNFLITRLEHSNDFLND
ncbi:hypothetical protein [Holospora elegans]|uniref:hypothetical protein n=1 Tax=Holospora elegans TaxID=431043 RepID=UPI0013922E15|nr:hypothetical protein [Holospora elegans]